MMMMVMMMMMIMILVKGVDRGGALGPRILRFAVNDHHLITSNSYMYVNLVSDANVFVLLVGSLPLPGGPSEPSTISLAPGPPGMLWTHRADSSLTAAHA